MKTILVVDDEFLASDIVAFALEDVGFKVVRAFDGRSALAILKTELPALVITDYMMPTMNGLELARAMKAEPSYRDIPIILMSGAQGDIARKFPELFAAIYDKPFSPIALTRQILELIGEPDAPHPDGEGA